MADHVVAGSRPWNRRVFDDHIADLPGTWHFAATPAELDSLVVDRSPRYVFFLHWSDLVPSRITDAVECVNFHMTDVPYGRGGSPLQNLIARGHTDTVLSAIRMTAAFDAGPVYAKQPLSLAGSAQEIYVRSGEVAATMIAAIARDEPEPVPQEGDIVEFTRRKPEQSEVTAGATLDALHDHIRMLDADGYPHAFLQHAGYRFELRGSTRHGDHLDASVRITTVPSA